MWPGSLQDGQIATRFLSENSKVSAAFDEVFKREGVDVIRPLPEAASETHSRSAGWARRGASVWTIC